MRMSIQTTEPSRSAKPKSDRMGEEPRSNLPVLCLNERRPQLPGRDGWFRRPSKLISTLLLAGSLSIACGDTDQLDEVRELQANGQVEESVGKLVEMIDDGDRRPEVLYRYGRGLSHLGEIGRALWPLDLAIDDPEFTVPAALELARNSIQGGNFEFALQTLERLRELRTDGAADTDARAFLLEARAHLDGRRSYDSALAAVERVLELDPGNAAAQRYQVVALLGAERPDEARDVIREFGLGSSSKAEGSSSKAEGFSDQAEGSSDQAEGSSDQAESSSDQAGGSFYAESNELPTDQEGQAAYWCSVGVSFHKDAGDLVEAEKMALECLEVFPDNPGTIDRTVEIYQLQRKHEKAVELLRAALENDPTNRRRRLPLVFQLRGLGRYNEAEAILQKAIDEERSKEFPDSLTLAGLVNDLGRFQVDRGNLEQGLQAFEEVLSLTKDQTPSPEFQISYAEALMRVGRFDEALAIANETPVEVHKPMIRGRVAYERGDFDEAIRELTAASTVWPNNATVRYYLARAAEAVGDFDRATEEYRQALRSDRSQAASRVRLGRLHLAENRVAQARAIMMIASPVANAVESLDAKRVTTEIEVRLGMPIDLRHFPTDPDRTTEEIWSSISMTLSEALHDAHGENGWVKALTELRSQATGPLKPFIFLEVVDALLATNRVDEAIDQARRAQADRPEDPRVALALGHALGARDAEDEEAVRLLQVATGNLSIAPRAHLALAELMARRAGSAAATEHLEAAIATGDRLVAANAIVRLADAMAQAGKPDQAIARLKSHLLEVDPYNGHAAFALAQLLATQGASEADQMVLALRARRFGAGEPATKLLNTLDPVRFPSPDEQPQSELGEETPSAA